MYVLTRNNMIQQGYKDVSLCVSVREVPILKISYCSSKNSLNSLYVCLGAIVEKTFDTIIRYIHIW